MRPVDYDAEWKFLAGLLPTGWQAQARTTGAIQRERGLSDPAKLLRFLLMHVATGLSLRQTVARAKAQQLANMTDAGLLDRLRRSERWLAWMCEQMFTKSRLSHAARKAARRERPLRAFDATVISEPGATGTDWRVHLSVGLPEMRCDFFALTDAKGGETFKRIPLREGDIVLGDRGYCHREAVARVVRHQADVVVRLNHNNFPMLTKSGKPFRIFAHLRGLSGHRPKAWPVTFCASQKLYPGRFCAVRKTTVAAELAQEKLRRAAKKKGETVSAARLEAAEYVFVFTTLTSEEFSVREILDLYRARWQVELLFKRLKSLLRLGHLPKKTDASSRAWLQAKLLVALLIEELMDQAGFSPWGFELEAVSKVRPGTRSVGA